MQDWSENSKIKGEVVIKNNMGYEIVNNKNWTWKDAIRFKPAPTKRFKSKKKLRDYIKKIGGVAGIDYSVARY